MDNGLFPSFPPWKNNNNKHRTRITKEGRKGRLKIFSPSPFFSFLFFPRVNRRVLSLLGKQGKDKRKKRKKNLGIWDQTEGRRERKSNYVKSEHARKRERERDGGERGSILSERLCPRTRFSNRSNLQSANRRRRQPSNKSNSRRNGEGGGKKGGRRRCRGFARRMIRSSRQVNLASRRCDTLFSPPYRHSIYVVAGTHV